MPHESSSKPRRQYGAIPFLRTPELGLRILLLTSRETRRWVIPKGWPMPGRTGPEVAAQEAYEEAGVRGRIAAGGSSLGRYEYDKRLTPAKSVRCSVKVFRLKVHRALEDWPEREQRERLWFDPLEAASLVQEPELAEMLRMLAQEGRLVEPIGIEPTTS